MSLSAVYWMVASDAAEITQINAQTGDESKTRIRTFPRDVRTWEVADVAFWAESILEYPFLIPMIEKHRVDGLTLLSLSEGDARTAFRIDDILTARKIGAHIRVLQGHCGCGPSHMTDTDFFQYFQRKKDTTWITYIASLFTPRITLWRIGRDALQSFLARPAADDVARYGHESYVWGTVRKSSTILYFLSWLFCPHLIFVYIASTWAASNYFIFGVYAISQSMIQLLEYQLIRDLRQTNGRERLYVVGTWLFPIAISVVVYVIGLILPSVAKDFVLYVIFVLQTVHIVSTIAAKLGYKVKRPV